MGIIIYFVALGASLAGAYFTAYVAFRRLWKNKVTHMKLTGFLVTFIVAFIAIGAALTMFVGVPFGR